MRQQAPNLENRIARADASAANGLGRLGPHPCNRRFPAHYRPKQTRGNRTSANWRERKSTMTDTQRNLFAVIVTAMLCGICLLGLVI